MSVVIDDFHVVGVTVKPSEADAPLIVDPDAVLAFALTGNCPRSKVSVKPGTSRSDPCFDLFNPAKLSFPVPFCFADQ